MRVASFRTFGAAALIAVFAGITLLVVVLWPSGPSEGADHAEAPGVMGDRAADINDIYAFRSPENPDNLVVALTVNPLTAPPENLGSDFATDVAYEIHVDNTGDLIADATVSVTFAGGEFTVAGLGDPITGAVTPASIDATPAAAQITESGGIRVFAGQRDDPFFFDLVGYTNFVSGPFVPAAGLRPAGEDPSDTLAGLNVSAIVIELPITALTGAETSDTGVIRAWATTSRDGARVDRMAIPAINTVLIPSDSKDAFNQGDPVNDEATFRAESEATIQGLRDAVDAVLGAQDGGPLGDLDAAAVAGAPIPDVVTIDFSQPVGFTNGRTLTDDVIDVALALVLNRTVGDAVDGNDVSFLSTFPYLAPPHQPAPAAAPATLSLNAGGQFVFWSFGPAMAADVFGSVKIAWLFNETTVTWTSFIPPLGQTNFSMVDGSVLWVVSDTAQNIAVG